MGEIRTNGGFKEQTVECGHFQKFLLITQSVWCSWVMFGQKEGSRSYVK